MSALGYMIWRRKGKSGTTGKITGKNGRAPWFRHDTLESAMTEAARLSAEHPGSRFLVMAIIAEVGPQPESGDQ